MSRRRAFYFSNFALRHFREMRILANGGVLGRGNEDWRNVAEHCLVEAVGADILAEVLGVSPKRVVSAALLHDWYKRREVEAMKLIGGGKGYEKTAKEDDRLLREYGISDEVIRIAHANIPESADAEYLARRPIEEKIMHFLDLVTSGTEFIDVDTRTRVAEQKKHMVEFSESFRSRYEGRTLHEVQREVTALEQREFEQEIGLESGALLDFLKSKLDERIVSAR
jgi:hypothetical protein